MECTKCKKKKMLNDYTLKNIKEGIYYTYCNHCRDKCNIERDKYKKYCKRKL